MASTEAEVNNRGTAAHVRINGGFSGSKWKSPVFRLNRPTGRCQYSSAVTDICRAQSKANPACPRAKSPINAQTSRLVRPSVRQFILVLFCGGTSGTLILRVSDPEPQSDAGHWTAMR